MLKMSQSFAIRMALWTVLVGYMVCDFFVFKGPLQSELRAVLSPEDRVARDFSRGICARVWNHPIYLSQVDRRVQEKLWRSGRSVEKISGQEKKLLRWAALDELITEAVLKIKVRAHRSDFPVSDTEIDAEVTRFENRFRSAEELDKALSAQGITSRKELRYRLAARLQQEKYISTKIADAIAVTEEETKTWYDEHKEELITPERRRVRHVFLATLDHPSDEAKAALAGHLERLQKGETDFIRLAAEVSEDLSNKHKGGDLGWMKKERLPGDFAAAVFSMKENEPVLIRTKLGWHVVEVTGVKDPELLPYEEMKDDIRTALINGKRDGAVTQYRHQLRVWDKDKIEIYRAMLE